MKLFLKINRYQGEFILAGIVIVTLLGLWLLFVSGLSDATQLEDPPDRSRCPKSTIPPCSLDAAE